MQTRDQTILMERIAGDTLRDIGERHDLSYEAVRLIARRAATAHISHLISQMWAAQTAGELLTLAAPGDDPADQRNAAAYLEWLLGEFERRDLRVATHYRPAVADGGLVGLCFAIEDLDFPTSQEGNQ